MSFRSSTLRRLCIAGLYWLALSPHVQAGEAPARPNLVVLLTDDMRWDCMSCAGHPCLQTPQFDRLAREGVRYANAFVTTSICCVSRASFLTGQYARRHRVGDFQTPLSTEQLAASYPGRLKAAGYHTCCLGKWGLGGEEPRAWFDTWYAWGGQGEFFEPVDDEHPNEPPLHNSELLARRAVAFLQNAASAEPGARAPFLLIVNYKAPHEPYQPDPQDAPLFRELPFVAPDSDFDRLPEFVRVSEGRRRLLRDCPTPEAFAEFTRQYLRCIAGVDRSVGKILDALDALRLADDTLVAFSSDNGFLLGDHGLSGKWLMYEESIRVPLLVRYPRAIAVPSRGTVSEQLALNIDLAPTLLAAAGLDATGMDGRSLLPARPAADAAPALAERGDQPSERSDFFYEHYFDFGGRIPSSEGVRTAGWKYLRYPEVDPPHEAMYNLEIDPGETQNLAAEPGHRARRDELRRRLDDYLTRLGSSPPRPK